MKRLLAFLAFGCAFGMCYALEAKAGLMKLSLIESSGRFNIYYQQDVSKSSFTPLLFERDPRTSSLNVLVDNKLYRLGESVDFRIVAQKNDAGAEFIFKSSFLQITQSFSFTASQEGGLADGVRISIKAVNLTDRDMSIGFRLILDSYLGEKSGTHFLTDLRPKISGETVLGESAKDSFLVSPSADNGKVGLKIGLKGGTNPDSVILANWSRINSSPWQFDYNQTRNFTLQPYSINDSAIALDYDPRITARSRSRDIVILLASRGSSDSQEALPAEEPKSVVAPPSTGSGEISTYTAVQADLLAVRDVIERINQKLSSGEALTPEENRILDDTLAKLKNRKESY